MADRGVVRRCCLVMEVKSCLERCWERASLGRKGRARLSNAK
jgi:hypothetical protein